jgi:protein gp37
MADVFEKRPDLDVWRTRLWTLIEQTKNLDWLLLTKRPQNIAALAPWDAAWPENVWLGTTVENQKYATIRIPELARHAAKVLFLSCEPLLGRIDIKPWAGRQINWVIAGGESGGSARPTDPQWVRMLRDQCLEAGIPFHFKQWGNWAPRDCPQETRVHLLPSGEKLVRLNKKEAGRLLDGHVWDGAPTA